MNGWDPEITVLSCQYCGGVTVEMAGLRRIQYPSFIKVLTVPCAGTIAPLHLLKALEQGADGVLVIACPESGCHHLTGNLRARKRLDLARAALQEAGWEAERLAIVQLGIGQAQAFADAVKGMAARLRELGPSHHGTSLAYAQGCLP
jgi:coenzyme F420-reducing hydrogenase delta subunit